MLQIKNLHASVGDRDILKGINLDVKPGEVHAIMGPNGSGKSTLANVIAGREDYTITKGSIHMEGKDIMEMSPELRALQGLFLSFQYPIEIPGVTVSNFVKTALNELRKGRGESAMDASAMLKKMKASLALLEMDKGFLSRPLNEGFSGGEKKRNEILQMALLEPSFCVLDETDSGLDIDALRIVGHGVDALKGPERSFLVITHYQRLLDHVVPDKVHVLQDGRIIHSGDKSLALELEERGYEWLIEAQS